MANRYTVLCTRDRVHKVASTRDSLCLLRCCGSFVRRVAVSG